MTERRPKDMTEHELCLLPLGPYVDEFIPHTAEEMAAGASGRGRVRIVCRPTMATYHHPDDWIGWRDPTGRAWTFGQFADGSWYKQPASFP